MRYIKLEFSMPVNYSIEQFVIDYPNAGIYNTGSNPDAYMLAQYNVFPLITTNPPVVEDTQICVEGLPSFNNGEWHQTWITRDRTEEEIDAVISEQTPIPADPEIALEFFASDELVGQRSEICSSCPSYSQLKICAECKCIMPLKVKIKAAVCPIGKW